MSKTREEGFESSTQSMCDGCVSSLIIVSEMVAGKGLKAEQLKVRLCVQRVGYTVYEVRKRVSEGLRKTLSSFHFPAPVSSLFSCCSASFEYSSISFTRDCSQTNSCKQIQFFPFSFFLIGCDIVISSIFFSLLLDPLSSLTCPS